MTRPAASFRDPSGFCCVVDGRVLRVLNPSDASVCEAYLQSPSARSFLERQQLVSTRKLTRPEIADAAQIPELRWLDEVADSKIILEHERIPFPSYPHEWSPEMLWAAASLTLELAQQALADGYGLKDATPSNVLFRGPRPVFVDLSSFEARAPSDPIWLAYGQFIRTFLLPLLANRYWGHSLADIFTTHRDGLEPEDVYRFCSWRQRFLFRIFFLVTMPTWLAGKAKAQGESLYKSHTTSNPEKARFILESLLKRLQRGLQSLRPRPQRSSAWRQYMVQNSYNPTAFAAKEQFVLTALQAYKPRTVLDVGANTGHFSLLAARAGAEVIAIEADPVCAGALWTQAQEKQANVLPLVLDFSRPTPALGWRNRESLSFLDRATGKFDCVLMLAVVHHLLVSERIPLDEILRQAADLTTALLILEFVPTEDQMFRQLTRGRGHLYQDLSQSTFEKTFANYFDMLDALAIPGTQRLLYLLRRKGA